MSKVLISFMGTTDYKEIHYTKDTLKSTKTRFVQEAIFQLFCQDFSTEDYIKIFVTDEAKANNWETAEVEGKVKVGLKDTFSRLQEQAQQMGRSFPQVELIRISSEQDEVGVWQLFEKITEQVHEGDELYFDTTNAFRSLSVIATSVLNYLKFTKNATVKGVYYGFYEFGQKETPIYDISSMIQIFDWTNGVETYIRTGEASLLKQTVQEQKQHKEIPPVYTDLVEALDDLSEIFATCRGQRLKPKLIEVRNLLDEAKQIESIEMRPLQNLFAIIDDKLDRIDYNNDYVWSLDVAKWCIQHNLIQQAVTFLREGIQTVICLALETDPVKYKYREVAWDVFYEYSQKSKKVDKEDFLNRIKRANPENNRGQCTLENFEAIYPNIVKLSPLLEELFSRNPKLVTQVTSLRNDINHASMIKPRRNSIDYRDKKTILVDLQAMITDLQQFYQNVEKTFGKDVTQHGQSQSTATSSN